MLKGVNWEPLYQRRMFSRLVMVYRILRDNIAIPKDLFFQLNTYQQTRSSTNLKLTRFQPRGNVDKFAFALRAVPEWNSLPVHIVNAPSVEAFRQRLSSHLNVQ